MTIHFQFKPSDIKTISNWYYTTKPDGKKVIWNNLVVLALMIVIMNGAAAVLTGYKLTLIIGTILELIALAIWGRKYVLGKINKRVSALYKTPENASLFGDRTLEIGEEGVTGVSSSTTTLWKWEAIQEIVETSQSTIFVLGPANGIVIPQNSVESGNYAAFVEEAKRLHQIAIGSKVALRQPAV